MKQRNGPLKERNASWKRRKPLRKQRNELRKRRKGLRKRWKGVWKGRKGTKHNVLILLRRFYTLAEKNLTTDKRSFLEKYFKHFAISIWLIVVIYFLLIQITPLGEIVLNISRCSDKKTVTNEKWNGTVYKKERIAHNHNVEGIFITNYQGYLTLIGRNRNLYYLTDLGDSIVKDVGSLKVTIYKRDSIINYDYFINCNE